MTEERRKKTEMGDEFTIKHVLGMTCPSASCLSANEVTDQVAFPAACILVLVSPLTGEQRYIKTPSLNQNIDCVAFSKDGRLIAFIENGVKSYMSVWLVKEVKSINYFQVDTSGKITFHPNKPFIVLIGRNKNISVYDYNQGAKIAYSQWTTTPLAMCIAHDDTTLIVSGHRKISCYSLQGVDSMARITNIIESKRTLTLGNLSQHTFVDIICGKDGHRHALYAVTTSGNLCILTNHIITKYEKIDVSLTCVAYAFDLLFVGCKQSVIKICDPDNLKIVTCISLNESIGPGVRPTIKATANVHTSGIVVSDKYRIITSVFSDSTIYSWQVRHTDQGIHCAFILPSYYRHFRCKKEDRDKKSAHQQTDSLGQQLHRVDIVRQFVCVTAPNLLAKRDACHGFWAAPHTLEVVGCHMNAVRFTPDGKDIISGDEHGDIKVHDAVSGVVRRVIEAHMSQVTYVEMLYDDDIKLICTGARDRVIFILNAAEDFSLVQVLCEHSAAITAIRLVRNDLGALTLVSAAADGVILVRNAIVGNKPQFYITSQFPPCTLAKQTFTCTSQWLATGCRNGTIHLFKTDLITANKPELIIQDSKAGGKDSLEALDIDPSGTFLAVGCCSGHTNIYHLQTGNLVTKLKNQRGLAKLHFTLDMNYMICQSFQGCALVWKLPDRMSDCMKLKSGRKCKASVKKGNHSVRGRSRDDCDSSLRSATSTPSIRSLNLLNTSCSDSASEAPSSRRHARDAYSSSSMSSSSSRLGCGYSTSDASVRMNSLPNIDVWNTIKSERRITTLRRSNTCDAIKRCESTHMELNRYNSDLSYVSNSNSCTDTISNDSCDFPAEDRKGIEDGCIEKDGIEHEQTLGSPISVGCRIQTNLVDQKHKGPDTSSQIIQLQSRTPETNGGQALAEDWGDGTLPDDRHACGDVLFTRECSSVNHQRQGQVSDVRVVSKIKTENTRFMNKISDSSFEHGAMSPIVFQGNSTDSNSTETPLRTSQVRLSPNCNVDPDVSTSDQIGNSFDSTRANNVCQERSHYVQEERSHFVQEERSHFEQEERSHFEQEERSHFVQEERSHCVQEERSHCVQEERSHFVQEERSHFVPFSEEELSTLVKYPQPSNCDRLKSMGYEVVTMPDEEDKDNFSNFSLSCEDVEVFPAAVDQTSLSPSTSQGDLPYHLTDTHSRLFYSDDSTFSESCSTSCGHTDSAADITSGLTTGQAMTSSTKSRDTDQGRDSQVSSFFKQEDYLKRLRDIRNNFEKNIQALKRERQLKKRDS